MHHYESIQQYRVFDCCIPRILVIIKVRKQIIITYSLLLEWYSDLFGELPMELLQLGLAGCGECLGTRCVMCLSAFLAPLVTFVRLEFRCPTIGGGECGLLLFELEDLSEFLSVKKIQKYWLEFKFLRVNLKTIRLKN